MYAISFSYQPSALSSRIYSTLEGKYWTKEERDRDFEEIQRNHRQFDNMDIRFFIDDKAGK